MAIKAESLNVTQLINSLPDLNYYEELAAISEAKIEVELAKNTPQTNFRFTFPEHRNITAELVLDLTNKQIPNSRNLE